jgi:RNA polymerase sigma factor (sigma-70 family)
MDSEPDAALLGKLEESRRAFLAIVEDVRPDLHRYCARMTGSVIDGEDVVQDVLARAYYELSTLKELPALRSWLFRIAHNLAVDYSRRYERRMNEPLDADPDLAADAPDPEESLARKQALEVALSGFLELPSTQRSCVILKDVFGHSVREIAALLDQSEGAISSALHRGRARLRALGHLSGPATRPRGVSRALDRYAALFNSGDWDGVRSLLIDDVRLELVSHWKREGRRDVSDYFTNYARRHDCRLVPGWLDGREVLAVFRDPANARPAYFIALTLERGRVSVIRDFRYVTYIAREATFERAQGPEPRAR